jgi:hypothetical protein
MNRGTVPAPPLGLGVQVEEQVIYRGIDEQVESEKEKEDELRLNRTLIRIPPHFCLASALAVSPHPRDAVSAAMKDVSFV